MLRTHDFEIAVGPKSPPSAVDQLFCRVLKPRKISGAHGGHAHYPAKSGTKNKKWKISTITWISHHQSIMISWAPIKNQPNWPKNGWVMAKKPLKIDKIGHISVHDFASACFTIWVITLHFSNFFHDIFRINVKLNFYLILLLGFLILVSRKIRRRNSKIFQAKVMRIVKRTDTKSRTEIIWQILPMFRGFLAIDEAV